MELSAAHRKVLTTLADDGGIDAPDAATTALLDELIAAGLASERPPYAGRPRGPFAATRTGRALAARFQQ
jgi:hypothetical protein